MAYEIKDSQDRLDDEQQQRLANPLAAGLASRTPGGPAPMSPLASSGNGTGRFVNFERYLNANLDASNRTADKVNSDVSKRATGAQNDLKTAVNAQNSRIANNSLTYGGQALQSTDANGGQTRLVAGNNGSVQASPGNSATDGYAITATGDVQTVPTTGYVTPEQAYANSTAAMNVGSIVGSQEYANAARSAGKANTLLNATGSTEGLQGILQQQVNDSGRGNEYTKGMNRFDGALVSSVGNQRFADTRKKFGNLEQMLGGAISADDAARQQAAASTSTAAGQYKAMYEQWLRDEEERKKREAKANTDQSDTSQHITMTTRDPFYKPSV